MNKMRPSTAKILVHSEGLGTPHTELVRKRAQEIAVINGHVEFTEEDWRQAKIELHGSHNPDHQMSDEMGMAAMVSEHGMVAADLGHQTEKMLMDDDGSVGEELFCEGMEEAEHERMLEARKEQDADDAEDAEDAVEP